MSYTVFIGKITAQEAHPNISECLRVDTIEWKKGLQVDEGPVSSINLAADNLMVLVSSIVHELTTKSRLF